MWSKSNTIVLVYVVLMSVFIGLLTSTNITDHWFDVLGQKLSQPQYHGLDAAGAILVVGAAAYLLEAELAPLMIAGSLGIFVCLTYNQDDLTRYLTLAAMLFSIGLYGMTVSRNAVRVLMSIELMLNAVNINLVAFSRFTDPTMIKGQLFAIFILTVAAAEAAVGLAVVLAIYRNRATVDMEKFNLLKW